MLVVTSVAICVGFFLDLFLGDPYWLYHPVRLMGKEIEVLENFIRKRLPKTKKGELLGGSLLVFIVCLSWICLPLCLLLLFYRIWWGLGFLFESFWIYQLLACKSLKVESMKVYRALKEKSLEDGRKAVSMIVGRDTDSLDEVGIVKATVETIAENTSDGIVAPLFYMALGGPVLGFLYKSINTMDSMIAYKNEKYLYFGRCAAKIDDVVNYLPARLSALSMLLAAYIGSYDGKLAWKIFKRDRYRHTSPNSAQTEAVMAGALGIELAGPAWYFGKLHKKPSIGDKTRPVEIEDIKKANRLLYLTSVLAFVFFLIMRLGLGILVLSIKK
ncbi:MAG TPA: adenosylcobinamide-phosphate synthase CbiB [Lachnospiraceae bacterium]